jgi:hypothetical protein
LANSISGTDSYLQFFHKRGLDITANVISGMNVIVIEETFDLEQYFEQAQRARLSVLLT